MPKAILRALAYDKDEWVREAAISNPSLPVDALRDVFLEEDGWLGPVAAANPTVRAAVLRDLGVGEDGAVREPRPGNPTMLTASVRFNWQYLVDLPPSKLKRAISLAGIPKSERAAKRRELGEAFVATHVPSNRPSLKRLACLLLPDCPTAVLAKTGRSTDWKERLAIACHPKTPSAIRRQLANDGNRFVRAAAQQAIEKDA
jgi:hypothetical protein